MLVSQYLHDVPQECGSKCNKEDSEKSDLECLKTSCFGAHPVTFQLSSFQSTCDPSHEHPDVVFPSKEAVVDRPFRPTTHATRVDLTNKTHNSENLPTMELHHRNHFLSIEGHLVESDQSSKKAQGVLRQPEPMSRNWQRRCSDGQKRSREDLRLYFPVCCSTTSRCQSLDSFNLWQSQSQEKHPRGSATAATTCAVDLNDLSVTHRLPFSVVTDDTTKARPSSRKTGVVSRKSNIKQVSHNEDLIKGEKRRKVSGTQASWVSNTQVQPQACVVVESNAALQPVHASRAALRKKNAKLSYFQLEPFMSGNKSSIQRFYYMDLYLCKNIQDANLYVASPNYFKNFKKCAHGQKVSAASRRAITQFIVDVGRGIATPISDFSIHMAINLFDRYMTRLGNSKNLEVKEKAAESIEIVGAACLYICSKLEDFWCLSLGDICKVFDDGSERCHEDVLHWELEISREFNFMFYSPTILDFMYKMIDLASPFLCHEKSSVSLPYSTWQHSLECFTPNKQTSSVGDLSRQSQEQKKQVCFSKSTKASNTTCHRIPCWDSNSLPFVAGTGNRGYSSPQYFLRHEGQWGQNDASTKSTDFDDRLAAEALSIAELSLLHHTCIGVPVHLIAAGALLVAITESSGKTRNIENLPQPVRAFLGKDRRRLARVVTLISAIVEERNLLVKKPVASPTKVLKNE